MEMERKIAGSRGMGGEAESVDGHVSKWLSHRCLRRPVWV